MGSMAHARKYSWVSTCTTSVTESVRMVTSCRAPASSDSVVRRACDTRCANTMASVWMSGSAPLKSGLAYESTVMPSKPMRTPAMPPSRRSMTLCMCSRNIGLLCPPACTRSGFRVSSVGPGREVGGDLGGRDLLQQRLPRRGAEHELDGAARALLVDGDAGQHLGRQAPLDVDGQAQA